MKKISSLHRIKEKEGQVIVHKRRKPLTFVHAVMIGFMFLFAYLGDIDSLIFVTFLFVIALVVFFLNWLFFTEIEINKTQDYLQKRFVFLGLVLHRFKKIEHLKQQEFVISDSLGASGVTYDLVLNDINNRVLVHKIGDRSQTEDLLKYLIRHLNIVDVPKKLEIEEIKR